jgi:hypothetical protein
VLEIKGVEINRKVARAESCAAPAGMTVPERIETNDYPQEQPFG